MIVMTFIKLTNKFV